MELIFCHVIGLNDTDKNTFLKDINTSMYNIIDTNNICKIIIDDNYYKNITEKLNTCKSKYEKNGINSCVMSYINNIILKQFDKSKKNIVIGSDIIYDCDLNLDYSNKFIIKHDLKNDISLKIQNNLEKHKSAIVDGTFPLSNIDKNCLVKKKISMINFFKKKGYTEIEYNKLIQFLTMDGTNILKNTLTNTGNNNSVLFIASKNKYKKNISVLQNKKDILNVVMNDMRFIFAYSFKWLAMISLIDDTRTSFKKSFIKGEPTIEVIDNSKEIRLNESCIVYEVDKKDFIQASNKNSYKFKTKMTKILNTQYIDSIKEELIQNGVKLIFN